MSLSVANPYMFVTSQGTTWGNIAGRQWNQGRTGTAAAAGETEAGALAGQRTETSTSEIIDVEATLVDNAQESHAQAAAERLVEIHATQAAYAYAPNRAGGVQFVYAALAPGQVLNRVA